MLETMFDLTLKEKTSTKIDQHHHLVFYSRRLWEEEHCSSRESSEPSYDLFCLGRPFMLYHSDVKHYL
nr:unnamed protein product [Digitaria exilis]